VRQLWGQLWGRCEDVRRCAPGCITFDGGGAAAIALGSGPAATRQLYSCMQARPAASRRGGAGAASCHAAARPPAPPSPPPLRLLAGQPWPANKRRKFMDNLSVLKEKTLGGDADEEVPLVWTFHGGCPRGVAVHAETPLVLLALPTRRAPSHQSPSDLTGPWGLPCASPASLLGPSRSPAPLQLVLGTLTCTAPASFA